MFVHPGLLVLQALYIDPAESHARPGAHVRVMHRPTLGLPVIPFVLEKADVNLNTFGRLNFRTEAVFHTSTGQQLFPPFAIPVGEEVTATLPTVGGARAIWGEVIADPGGATPPATPVPQPDLPLRRPGRPLPAFRTTPRAVGGRVATPMFGPRRRVPDLRPPTSFDPADVRPGLPGPGGLTSILASGMRVEAFVRSAASGTTSHGTRSDVPFAFSAPGLTHFVIRGSGTVVGVRWLDAGETQKGLEWRVLEVLNLPHPGGRRYLSLSDWQLLCDRRVSFQSPKRRPMQDVNGAVSRLAAPAHPEAEEFDRVQTLFDGLNKPLNELITAPTPQHQQVTRHPLLNDDGTPAVTDANAEATSPTLGFVLQGQTDPGVGSWMGYKTYDRDNVGNVEHRLTFYRIRGYFRNPTDDVLADEGLVLRLLVQAARQSLGLKVLDEMMSDFTGVAGGWLEEMGIKLSVDMAPVTGMIMGAQAVADYHAPLDPLPEPDLDTPRHVAWLPSPIDDPYRATETAVRGIPASGALAVQMRQPPVVGAFRRLNRTLDIGQGTWRSLMLPSLYVPQPGTPPLPPGTPPPDTVIADTRTGPEAFTLHAAAMDRFGRFSEWAVAHGEAGPRPRPPQPVLIGHYQHPDIDTGVREGTISAVIPLPEDEALAPGSFPLLRADLTVEVDGVAFGPLRQLPVSDAVSIHPNNGIDGEVVPADQDYRGVRVRFAGPTIPSGATRNLRMTAVWRDTQLQTSIPSLPVELKMVDPYPPAQIPIPDVLDYSARPDATGAAWVERDIPGASGDVSYAVYYADENRLRDHLRRSDDAADATLLAELEAEPDPAARATALRAVQGRFPGTLFERLEGAVETAPTLRFRHALPGTLRVLSAYKIAVEAGANAAGPDLSTLDTVFYGVPNSDPPPRPSVRVALVPPLPGEPDLVVAVTVTLRPGLVPGQLARIRRTRSGVVDPLRNPVAGTVPFEPVDPETGLQAAVFRDVGAALIAPAARLAAFVDYAWIAEAQGGPEPGSVASASGPVPGLWSPASAPATLTLIPDTGPVAPTLTGASSVPAIGGRTQVEITFAYPVDLTPGSPGPWTIRLERGLPDQGLELISEAPAVSGAAFTVGTTGSEIVPTGTRFRVRVIDPVGRESPVVEHVL